MVIRELVTLLGFKADDKAFKEYDRQFGKLKDSARQLSIFAAAAGGAIFGLAKTTANAGDVARKTAQGLGLTTEAFQELAFAAKINGVEQDQFRAALSQMTAKLREAGGGTGMAAESFKKLGVEVKDSNGQIRNTDLVLGDLAEALSKLPDGAQKTALAMSTIGEESGSRLIPFLNQGRAGIEALRKEAIELGIVLSDDTAKASEEFNDSLTRAQSAMTGLRNIIGGPLLKALTPMIKEFTNYIKLNKDIIKQNMEGVFEGLFGVLKGIFGTLGGLLKLIANVSKAFGGLGNVIKFVTFAFVGFKAATILVAIGGMVMNLAKAFSFMGNAALLAQAKAIALPLAIGAAIAGIIALVALAVEDIVAFFDGRDSLTGRIVQAFNDIFPELEEWFGNLTGLFGTAGKVLITTLLTPLRAIVNGFKTIVDVVDIFRGKIGIGDALKNAGNRFLNTIGLTDGSLGSALGMDSENTIGNVASSLGMASPASVSNTSNAQNNVNINSPVNVSVPEGTPPGEVGDRVYQGVRDGLAQVLRPANQSLKSGVAY